MIFLQKFLQRRAKRTDYAFRASVGFDHFFIENISVFVDKTDLYAHPADIDADIFFHNNLLKLIKFHMVLI